MDSLFLTNTQSDDFANGLDFRDANATDEEMMWVSSDLLNYQPLLHDCMLSQASDIPVPSNAKDVMLSSYSQHFAVKDNEIEQELLTFVNPNMAMTLDKDGEGGRMEEVMDLLMTEAQSVLVSGSEPEPPAEENVPITPAMPTVICNNSNTRSTYVLTYRPTKSSILKPQTIALAPQYQSSMENSEKAKQTVPSVQKVQIRLMPRTTNGRVNGTIRSQENMKILPLSPPNSDSDCSLSPVRSEKINLTQTSLTQSLSTQKPKLGNQTLLLSNSTPTSGSLFLSEEEERTLISEGYPVPTKWPLTKQEEKILKKIQRKIKNKVSAQESRRKKKDYIDSLEKRLEASNHENTNLKKKLDKLEHGNRALISQIEQLKKALQSFSSQTSTYVMVFVLFFALFLGVWSPLTSTTLPIRPSSAPYVSQHMGKTDLLATGQQGAVENGDYRTPSMKSRTLMSIVEDHEDSSDAASSATCYSGMLSWFSMLHTGPKLKHCDQLDDPAATAAAAAAAALATSPLHIEVKSPTVSVKVLENQTEWKNPGDRQPAVGIDMIYTSDLIGIPASES